MAKTVRTVVIVLLTMTMTSCRWLGCRGLGCRKKPPEYSKPLPPGQMALRKLTDPKDYPDFGVGWHNRDGLVMAIDNSLAYYGKPSSKQYFPYLDISHARAVNSLETFKAVLQNAKDAADLHRLICERFEVYISVGCDDLGTVLFTGYCTPIYKGSRKMTQDFRYPLYRQPPDLEKKPDGTPLGRRLPDGNIVPYYTRRELDVKQLLAGKGLDLVYLADPLEAYIIHVQGSGRIELADGSMMYIGYAGKTDRPYVGLGRSLVDDKRIAPDELSLQAVIDYFKKYPHELKSYMYKNESYVFFTEYPPGGPYGSLNVPVIPYRSIATDKAVFPRGLLAYTVTKAPMMKTRGQVTMEPFYSFVLDQDTGGAIRSAGRCDVYMGVGPDAVQLAGRTHAEGKLYYVAVKELPSLTGPPVTVPAPPPRAPKGTGPNQ